MWNRLHIPKYILLILSVIISNCGCSRSTSHSLNYETLSKVIDSSCYSVNDKCLQMFVYVDSSVCIPCWLPKYIDYKYYIDLADSNRDIFSFMIVLSPNKEDKMLSSHIVKTNNVLSGISYYSHGHFSVSGLRFKRCTANVLLTDSSGQVLIYGNPLTRRRTRDEYDKILKKNKILKAESEKPNKE